MDSDVVEVVARFGGTILDVAHLGPNGTYRIGTAPDVNLAVPGVTCFPLVDGRTVRCPVGMRTIERDGATELSIGALTIRVARTKLPRAPMARPRVDWRPAAFVVGSLLVHLILWFVAAAFAPFERIVIPRAPRFRLAHVADPPPVPERKPSPHKQPVANASQPARVPGVPRAERSKHRAARSETTVDSAIAGVLKSFDDINVAARLGELDPDEAYNPELEGGGGFGAGRSFDPTKRDGWGTIETGPYALMLYDVKLCPDKSCTVDGPIPALYVRTHLHKYMDAIYDCYAQHASGPGTIVLEFTITADGAVRDARGSGLGETGACAARVAGEIFFKALGSETRVRYPLRFNPSRG